MLDDLEEENDLSDGAIETVTGQAAKKPRVKRIAAYKPLEVENGFEFEEGPIKPLNTSETARFMDENQKTAEVLENIHTHKKYGGEYNPIGFKDVAQAAWDSTYNDNLTNFLGIGKDYVMDKLGREPDLTYDEYKTSEFFQPEVTEERFNNFSRKTARYLERASQEIEDDRYNDTVLSLGSGSQRATHLLLSFGFSFADAPTLALSMVSGGLFGAAAGATRVGSLLPRMIQNSAFARAAVGGAVSNLVFDIPFNETLGYPRRKEVLEKEPERLKDYSTSLGVGAGFGVAGHGVAQAYKKFVDAYGMQISDIFKVVKNKFNGGENVKARVTPDLAGDMVTQSMKNEAIAKAAVRGDTEKINAINADVRYSYTSNVQDLNGGRTILPSMFGDTQVDYKFKNISELVDNPWLEPLEGKKTENRKTIDDIKNDVLNNRTDKDGVSAIEKLIYSDSLEHGSPVISDKGQIISGSNRLKALKELYDEGHGKLIQDAYSKMFPHRKGDLDEIDAPIFVRQTLKDLPDAEVLKLAKRLDKSKKPEPNYKEFIGNDTPETINVSSPKSVDAELNSKRLSETPNTNDRLTVKPKEPKKTQDLKEKIEGVENEAKLDLLDETGKAEHNSIVERKKSILSKLADFGQCMINRK